jgi:hypothetical protein
MGHVLLQEHTGDIWALRESYANLYPDASHWVVVPINQEGVMGAGLAKEALMRFWKQCGDDITARKGQVDRPHSQQCLIRMYPPLIFFPTKWKWSEPSPLDLVEASMRNLTMELALEVEAFNKPLFVAMPHVGCGLGGLEWKHVKTLVEAMAIALDLLALPQDITITLVTR